MSWPPFTCSLKTSNCQSKKCRSFKKPARAFRESSAIPGHTGISSVNPCERDARDRGDLIGQLFLGTRKKKRRRKRLQLFCTPTESLREESYDNVIPSKTSDLSRCLGNDIGPWPSRATAYSAPLGTVTRLLDNVPAPATPRHDDFDLCTMRGRRRSVAHSTRMRYLTLPPAFSSSPSTDMASILLPSSSSSRAISCGLTRALWGESEDVKPETGRARAHLFIFTYTHKSHK